MGIGKSLKKFVKKAAPIAAMVATPFLGPTAGALLGAASGALSGGGVKGALLGGLGGYAAGGFGKGIGLGQPGGIGNLLSNLKQPGGLANVFSQGIKGITGSPLGQGIGSMVNKFTGATGITGQGFTPGQPLPGGQEFLVKTAGGDGDSYFATADEVIQGVDQGSIDPTDIMTKDGNNVSISSILGMYQQGQGQGQGGGGIMGNLLYGLGAGIAQHRENEANPQLELPLIPNTGVMDYDTGRGEKVKDPVLTADFGAANGGRIGYANGNEVDPEYEGWKKMYKQNPEVAMVTHPNAAEYLKRYEIEMMPIDTKARGGIIGLANGGEPTHEMDLRGGGFIPVGAYERADDVPARVSKNEFVMTADAVRAAGGGSIDKGSQIMYDLMNNLEARA